MHVCICDMFVGGQQIEVSDPFVPGVTGFCEPPDMDAENQTQALLKSNKHSYLSSPKFIYFFHFCVYALPACMYVQHVHAW